MLALLAPLPTTYHVPPLVPILSTPTNWEGGRPPTLSLPFLQIYKDKCDEQLIADWGNFGFAVATGAAPFPIICPNPFVFS